MHWELALGRLFSFSEWSFGEVASIQDLYSQAIFGPARDLACECGRYCGDPEYDGVMCDLCGVKVAKDALVLRRTRLGHIRLACRCRHPMGAEDDYITEFPIAPVAYRVGADGHPTALGIRYEALVRANLDVRSLLPSEGSTEYYRALQSADTCALQSALDALVGRNELASRPQGVEFRGDAVLPLLFGAIGSADPYASVLFRCAGFVIKFGGEM